MEFAVGTSHQNECNARSDACHTVFPLLPSVLWVLTPASWALVRHSIPGWPRPHCSALPLLELRLCLLLNTCDAIVSINKSHSPVLEDVQLFLKIKYFSKSLLMCSGNFFELSYERSSSIESSFHYCNQLHLTVLH